ACAVLAVVLAQRGGDPPAPSSDVAAIARLSPRLAAHFAILRRPPRAGDALPERVRRLLPAGLTSQVAVRHARLVARRGPDSLWVLPGRGQFCLVYGAAPQVGYACHGGAAAGTYAQADRSLVYALLPDGTTGARLELGGRVLQEVPIRSNGVLVPIGSANRLTWRTADGRRHGAVLHEPGIYTPAAVHHTRPPGSVFNDEIGENIVGLRTPYARVVELFGSPAHIAIRHSDRLKCVFYRVVGASTGWQFCFRDERMTSASGFAGESNFPRFPQTP
ncbi:MAG: hypothetical protein JWM73_2108, partial [Solirubrobacterales bacterium]|nr:hypothetical protein [Solirubrobacterales bacterium]